MSDETRLAAAQALIGAIDQLLEAVATYRNLPYQPPDYRRPGQQDYDHLANLQATVHGHAAAAALEAPPPLEDAGLSWCEAMQSWSTEAVVYGPDRFPGAREEDPAWRRGLNRLRAAATAMVGTPEVQEPLEACRPRWDTDRRELYLGATLLKRYRQRAERQCTVLESFEELGWPPRIDDPLPALTLADTVTALNEALQHTPLRFRRDGTGKGIIWEVIDA
jgi:hypothetical protein